MSERVAGRHVRHPLFARFTAIIHPHVRHSVFAKLVTVMLAMAAILLALVAGFFLLYVSPELNASIDRVVQEYARGVAVTAPSYDTAKQLSARLSVQMRYEGPDGAWATADDLPTIADARRDRHRPFGARRFSIMPGPNGGTYLFAWTLNEHVHTAHLIVLAVLLVLMAGVVFITHAVLRHVLQPLRALGDGVARLSDGHLDVVVPKRSADEFGVLTSAFNQMVGRIREMVRSRDQLLLDVSHELRSPVTRLKVALELLSDANMKARMAADLAEMEIMIGELVELERLRDGHGIRTARQNVMPMLDEVARTFQDRPPSVRVASTTPEIFADIDADRMRTVVRNLLENAIKYSLPDSRAVNVCAAQNGEHVVIRVSDDGPGIPERDIASLFEPFFRLDRSRSKKTGGYGLGLSISKRIVGSTRRDDHGPEQSTARRLVRRHATESYWFPSRGRQAMIMTPGLRKFALTTHVTASVGWLGAVGAFLALAIVGRSSQDPQTVRAAYLALPAITWFVIVPLTLAALLTGIVQSLGTTWGLFQHYWIVTKLLLTVLATILLLVHTQLIDRVATRAAEATLSTGDLRQSRIELVAKAGAALLVLLVATTLSVYKPWGMTPYGLRKQNEATAASRATTTRQTAPWGGYVLFGIIGLVLLVLLVHLAGGGMHGH